VTASIHKGREFKEKGKNFIVCQDKLYPYILVQTCNSM
jgi:hypothetical protein